MVIRTLKAMAGNNSAHAIGQIGVPNGVCKEALLHCREAALPGTGVTCPAACRRHGRRSRKHPYGPQNHRNKQQRARGI